MPRHWILKMWSTKRQTWSKIYCLIVKEKEIIRIILLCSTNLLHLLYIILIEKIMAIQIEETPVLYGEDAVRFLKEMENVKSATDE